MSVEIRAVTPEEMEELRRIGMYAFANNEQDPADASNETLTPEWTTCAFVDGRMGATMAAYPFRMRFNGAAANVAGITAVATLPEFRRRGLLRQLMEQSFREQRERGQSLAMLWASMGAIYQRFGYGLASTQVFYAFDPRRAAYQSGEPPAGTVELMSEDDARPIIERLYVEYSRHRNLMLHRAPQLWEALLRVQEKQKLYFAVYRNAGGEPRGYAAYQTRSQFDMAEPGPDQVLTTRDFVPVDAEAHRGLWEFFRKHDLVKRVEIGNVAEDDPAPLLLLEPRELRRMTSDGVWLRVVDVEDALVRRPYGDRGELTLEIAGDEMCEWNNGAYLLETDGERSEVMRTDREPELTMPPRTLATLIAGHSSATQLSRVGLLEARDERALATADRLFATKYRPYCANGF